MTPPSSGVGTHQDAVLFTPIVVQPCVSEAGIRDGLGSVSSTNFGWCENHHVNSKLPLRVFLVAGGAGVVVLGVVLIGFALSGGTSIAPGLAAAIVGVLAAAAGGVAFLVQGPVRRFPSSRG